MPVVRPRPSAVRDQARASVRRYADCGAVSPWVGGISGTDFDATLEGLAGALDG